jgi:CheY-like chemotaxis protein
MSSAAPPPTAALILLAEDNAASAEVTKEILNFLGFRVIVASDGLSTVKAACENQPDLILMDWHMPGLDGLSATRQIKANPATSTIPIISLTAFALEQDVAACRAAGAIDHITKPVDFESLPERLRPHLRPRSPT